jgi:aminoglycoside 6-adenylyltransferase
VEDVFLERLLAWASQRPDVEAILQTGSRMRGDGSVDEFSDYDVELYVADPTAYDDDDASWLVELGDVMVYQPLGEPEVGLVTRLVFFADATKSDVQIYPVAQLDRMAAEGLDPFLHERGYRVLLDRSGRTARLPAATRRPPRREPPTEAEFRSACREFWFEAAHIPRSLRRGELWVVKHRDWTMKQVLLQVLEWHAQATHGQDHDTWYIGTKLQRWLDPALYGRLDGIFARFDAEDSWRALAAQLTLFEDASGQVARGYGFAGPAAIGGAAAAYVRSFPELAAAQDSSSRPPSR